MNDDISKAIQNEINDYEQTVDALLAFAALVVHDGSGTRNDAYFGFGRRMKTSEDNPIQPLNQITPDLTAQKSLNYGVVAEVKKSLSRDRGNWLNHVKQLRKYDDNLVGWWTDNEYMDNSDTIMLIHQSRSRDFTDYLQEIISNDPDAVGMNTSVVEFNRFDETTTYFFFRKEYGQLRDKELQDCLYSGRAVPLEKVKTTFKNICYYDSEPHVIFLLEHLWTDVFPSIMNKDDFDEETKSFKIQVKSSDITNEMQSGYGSGALHKDRRSPEFPRETWVRKALDWLVQNKKAKKISEEENVYIILFKFTKKDVREYFIDLEVKSKSKKKREEIKEMQLPLIFEKSKSPSKES